MKDSALMRGLDGAHDLEAKSHGFIRCKRSPQRRALDVLEHEVARADVVDLTDVRVVQAGDRARFLFEPAQSIGLRDELWGQHFDRDIPTQSAVASTIDLAHASSTNGCHDFIWSEARAGRERHGFGFQLTMSLIGVRRTSCTRAIIRKRCPSCDTTYSGPVPLGPMTRPTRVVKRDTGIPGVTDAPFAVTSMGTAMSFPSSAM